MQICRKVDLQKCRFAEMQILQKCRFCRNADLQKCRFAELQICKKCRFADVQKWGSLRVDCTTSEMQVRVADLQNM